MNSPIQRRQSFSAIRRPIPRSRTASEASRQEVQQPPIPIISLDGSDTNGAEYKKTTFSTAAAQLIVETNRLDYALRNVGSGGPAMYHTRMFRRQLRKLRNSFLDTNSRPEWQVTLQMLLELDIAVKGLRTTFKDFISMAFNERLMASLADLRKKLKIHREAPDQSRNATKAQDAMRADLAENFQSLQGYLKEFIDEDIKTIKSVQKDQAQAYINTTLVGTFLSGVTASMLQIVGPSNAGDSTLAVAVNASLFSSLVLSTASAVQSLLSITWMKSFVRLPEKHLPHILYAWLHRGPMVSLLFAGALFAVGLVLFVYSSQQHLVTSVITTSFATIQTIGVLGLTVLFYRERWRFRQEAGVTGRKLTKSSISFKAIDGLQHILKFVTKLFPSIIAAMRRAWVTTMPQGIYEQPDVEHGRLRINTQVNPNRDRSSRTRPSPAPQTSPLYTPSTAGTTFAHNFIPNGNQGHGIDAYDCQPGHVTGIDDSLNIEHALPPESGRDGAMYEGQDLGRVSTSTHSESLRWSSSVANEQRPHSPVTKYPPLPVLNATHWMAGTPMLDFEHTLTPASEEAQYMVDPPADAGSFHLPIDQEFDIQPLAKLPSGSSSSKNRVQAEPVGLALEMSPSSNSSDESESPIKSAFKRADHVANKQVHFPQQLVQQQSSSNTALSHLYDYRDDDSDPETQTSADSPPRPSSPSWGWPETPAAPFFPPASTTTYLPYGAYSNPTAARHPHISRPSTPMPYPYSRPSTPMSMPYSHHSSSMTYAPLQTPMVQTPMAYAPSFSTHSRVYPGTPMGMPPPIMPHSYSSQLSMPMDGYSAHYPPGMARAPSVGPYPPYMPSSMAYPDINSEAYDPYYIPYRRPPRARSMSVRTDASLGYEELLHYDNHFY